MSNNKLDYYRQLQQANKERNKVILPTLFLQRAKTAEAAKKALGNHTKD